MITEEKRKVLDLFAEGRRFYKMMKFVEARDAFVRALQVLPDDGPSREYLKRCDEYIKEPPAEDWDGAYVMKTK